MICSPHKSLQKFVFKYFLLMGTSENSLLLKVCPLSSCFRVNWGDCYESKEQDATQPNSYWYEGWEGDGNDGVFMEPIIQVRKQNNPSCLLLTHCPHPNSHQIQAVTACKTGPSLPTTAFLPWLPNMSPGSIIALCPLILHTASRTIFLKHKCDYLTRHLLC